MRSETTVAQPPTFDPRTVTARTMPAPASGILPVPAIEVSGLRRVFSLPRSREQVTAVDGVSLRLERASLTALVGPSGCGKSTLLQCVAGLDRPTDGEVRLLGQPTSRMNARAMARVRAAHVGFIFQDDNLVTSLSALDNVALPGRLRRRPLPRARVRAALERVGLGPQARQLPSQLSGGQRQRVAIARVLASEPEIIFADEPTAALDVAAGAIVLDWLVELARGGACVLMVTHDAAAAARAERVLVMAGGRIVRELAGGDPAAVAHAVLATQTEA